ncbi:uncharacterized protein LOC142563498 [Dermacentor variabilis]|uniref:uncharacterized protein LOC142563498 n=1 Tax=Dermacentor variabilis TaxID=34621 RepID=UPI003F5B093A
MSREKDFEVVEANREADKEALWLQLKALLDSQGPARKTVQQWQAFWRKQRFYADQALALSVPPDESLQARALSGDFRRPQPIQPLPAQPTVSVGETPGTSGLQCLSAPAPPQRQRRRRVPPAGAREALPRLVELHTRSSEQQQQTNTLIAELREAATRQAVALEQLATEARLHREAAERQATALEAILQQQGQALQELRSVGALSRAIAAALGRPAQ